MGITVANIDDLLLEEYDKDHTIPLNIERLRKYPLVVDPGNGEPVKSVEKVEWDDERKVLVLKLDG